MRPRPARWFELLTTREHLSRLLDLLAHSHVVELESRSEHAQHARLPELGTGLDTFREAARKFAEFWPAPRIEPGTAPREPQKILDDALGALQRWIREAGPLVEGLQHTITHRAQLEQVRELLIAAGGRIPPLDLLGGAGPTLKCGVFRLADGTVPISRPPSVLLQRIAAGERLFVVAVGPAAQLDTLAEQLLAAKAERLVIPVDELRAGAADLEAVEKLIEGSATRLADCQARLQALNTAHRVDRTIGDLAFLDWFSTHVPAIPVTEHFAWVTGWTIDDSGAGLRAALDREHLQYLLHFPPPPEGLDPPVTLRNPPWVRPFEFFARLLGTPGLSEADPSILVAIIAPLVFGIMFADVGQGAILVVAGLALRRRFPLLTLLIPGGLASMVFGALFGSVFGREDILHALWFYPLEQPLFILLATLGLGIGVIFLGLALDALEHLWARQGARWLASKAGLALCYAGLLLGFWQLDFLWLALAGVAWFMLGAILLAHRGARLARIAPALGELTETLLQIAVNTLSFLRVGAFALAHCGLSFAIVGLAGATSSKVGYFLVLALGNVFVIALEALVAGIQTTRLVLFEFFVRFLRGLGREFRPLFEMSVGKTQDYGRTSA